MSELKGPFLSGKGRWIWLSIINCTAICFSSYGIWDNLFAKTTNTWLEWSTHIATGKEISYCNLLHHEEDWNPLLWWVEELGIYLVNINTLFGLTIIIILPKWHLPSEVCNYNIKNWEPDTMETGKSVVVLGVSYITASS